MTALHTITNAMLAFSERVLPGTLCGRCGCRAKNFGCSCSCHRLWCDCHGERHALCAQLSVNTEEPS